MKKRLYSFLMVVCVFAVSLSAAFYYVHAKENPGAYKYVAFGDSIAAGYGLNNYAADQTSAPADSYQALTGNFLKTSAINYAVSGTDSEDCIELLESGKADADLANADVITVSIGSNDLLLPFIQIVMDYYGIDASDLPDMSGQSVLPEIDFSAASALYEQASGLISKLSDNALLHAQANAFPEKFAHILALFREKAPHAEIYVTNIYNPFVKVPIIGALAETYIAEINRAFSASAKEYTLVDVYTPFEKGTLTNVNINLSNPSGIRLDPHPSKEGHQAIADLIIRALKNNHAPAAASIQSMTSGSKYKLTVKIKPVKNADGYQIRFAASKKGTYRTLATTAKTTFRSNSKLLKSKKTYYITVRDYKKINGVTYYGKTSAIKKIRIR